MHWTHRTYEEKKEERPPRSAVRQTGLKWTQKMRITPLNYSLAPFKYHVSILSLSQAHSRSSTKLSSAFWGTHSTNQRRHHI